MNWQFKTILFEFQKDGILGDRYIDDDEMEKVFNEQGRQGWELITVTPVQEGLISFFKRALPQIKKQAVVKPVEVAESMARSEASSVRPVLQKSVPREKTVVNQPNRQADKLSPQSGEVGEIKIS